jgi:acetolactate synthase I/II/III large subunit
LANQPGDRLLDSADVVITIGYDPVEYPPGDWNRNSARKIIHIDVLPGDLDNSYRPSVELIGDIASTLNLLTRQLKRTHRSDLATRILKAIAVERAELNRESATRNGTPIHPLRLVAELQPLLSSDVTLCSDMGSFHLWLARHLYFDRFYCAYIKGDAAKEPIMTGESIPAIIANAAEKTGRPRSDFEVEEISRERHEKLKRFLV